MEVSKELRPLKRRCRNSPAGFRCGTIGLHPSIGGFFRIASNADPFACRKTRDRLFGSEGSSPFPKISAKKPFSKLKGQRGMRPEAKVGSWLEVTGSAAASEAYSSSDAESSSSGSEAGNDAGQIGVMNRPRISSEEDEEEDERDKDVDWDVLLPKIRPAIMDRSKKRRKKFILRYLTVTGDCMCLD